jgi:hypothetical protein
MPRASVIRRWGLTTRGRDYQLTPAFPRLPGIIPEGPASGPPLARKAFPRGALVNSVSDRLVCRVVKFDPILGVTLC